MSQKRCIWVLTNNSENTKTRMNLKKYNIEKKKLDTKDYILYNFIHVKLSEKGKCIIHTCIHIQCYNCLMMRVRAVIDCNGHEGIWR